MRRGCLGAAARRLPRQQSLEPLFVPLVRLPPLLAGLLTTEGFRRRFLADLSQMNAFRDLGLDSK
jgi:hypothetical protein